MQTLARERLYEMVWEVPISKLAVDLGVSDYWLRKACVEAQIPLPGLSYWGRRRHGQDPQKKPLGELPAGTSGEVIVGKSTKTLPSPLPPALAPAVPVTARISARLEKIRRAVDRTMAIARSFSGVNEFGCVRIEDPNAFAMRAPPASFDRLEHLLKRIAEVMITRGHNFCSGENRLVFMVDGEEIGLFMVQPMNRRPHIPTADDRAREKKRQDELGWRMVMLLGGSKIPQWDYEPGPEMVVEIGGSPRLGPAHRIRDTRQRTLEERIGDIANVFEAHAQSIKCARERHKVEDEEARLRTIARLADARRAELEKRRKAYLDQKLLQHNECVRIERMLATIAELGGASDVAVVGFVEWATAHLAIARAAFAAEQISREAFELFFDNGE